VPQLGSRAAAPLRPLLQNAARWERLGVSGRLGINRLVEIHHEDHLSSPKFEHNPGADSDIVLEHVREATQKIELGGSDRDAASDASDRDVHASAKAEEKLTIGKPAN